MIVVTSISPKHFNKTIQTETINSWKNYGNCYSLNTSKEIEQVSGEYNEISFIETHRTVEFIFGKPCVSINSMIDFAIEKDEDLLFINSDITINEIPDLKRDGLTFFSRYDYIDSFADGKIFQAGFDVYFIPKHFLKIFPPSIYAMGLAWWDYALIYRFILKNIPIYWPQGKYAFHKWHQTQYSVEEWLRIGEFFRLEFNIPKHLNVGQMATDILTEIKSIAIKY